MEGNEFAFGLDIGAAPRNAQAQARGRDTGGLVTSGRLVLAGVEGYVALSMRLPMYRNGASLQTLEDRRAAFIGTVGAGYNVRKLMAGVLDQTTMTVMRYRLYDVGVVGATRPADNSLTLLFDSAQVEFGVPKDDFTIVGAGPVFETVLPIDLAGRNWELKFSAPKEAFVERADAIFPWLVLLGGLVSSALICAVLYSFSSSRERALALAQEITRELRGSEANLAHAQAQAHLGSWTLDLNAGRMTWSPETFRLLQKDSTIVAPDYEEFLDRHTEQDRDAFKREAERCIAAGEPSSCEYALHFPGAEDCWVHYVLQPLAASEGTRLRGTIMDITERKRALETQRTYAEQIRDLLRRLVSVQEAERRGLSANLHDLVGQSLSVLGMSLETIRSALSDAAQKRTEATFSNMNQLLKETMRSVRSVMSDLRPPLLDDYGLYAAIEWHARQFESRTGLRVILEGAAPEPRRAPEVELALFRIAQEALINVAKHASASSARISITGDAGCTLLLIEDDGQGAPRAAAANDPDTSGWGMAVMRERAAAVGGALRVEHAGRGMRIVVEIGK
ncbi:MAG: hypothetical protein EXR28_03450 [Betaproteobacteria bacterium]|nr:hypothetical protein [Betaproteobacteria bacterium]